MFKNSLSALYTQPALTCWARCVFMSSADPRHVGAAGKLIIWRPLQPMFFKVFRSRTWLAKSWGRVHKLLIIFAEIPSRVESWVY